jgi:intracellular sulfur oxidation DsrE/DsrF family protein
MKPWQISVILLFILSLIPGTALAGRCIISGPRYNLSGDAVGWSMRIGSGQTCLYGLRYNDVAMEKVVISSSPQSGEVALLGPAFTYTAKPDFEGQDSFTVVISGSIKKMPGTSTIQISVAVASAPANVNLERESPAAQRKSDAPPLAMQRLVIQVAERDEKLMNLALNNAQNVLEYYKAGGEPVSVEIVAFGPGLHMLRADTSPVKDRIAVMALEYPELAFMACADTQRAMSKAEDKPITLISEAKFTPFGVVRLIELQEQGYGYIRP